MRRREKEILSVLANCLRVLSLNQVVRHWWSENRSGRSRARKSLDKLAAERWLHVDRVLSRPIGSLSKALLVWHPDDFEPDFAQLSRRLHRRAMKAAEMVTVVYTTRKTMGLFGKGRLPTIKLTQMTHDLHVSEVLLGYLRRGLAMERWVSEDRLPRDWPLHIRPDAVIQDERGNLVKAVEYGGDYRPDRLQQLHDGLSAVRLSYEIW